MTKDDFIKTKQELEEKKRQLSSLKVPAITAQMRHAGLRTRPQRQEIIRYKREISRQKQAYEEQIIDINKYLAESRKQKKEKDFETQAVLEPPRISLFKHPELARTRMLKGKRAGLKRVRWF